MKHASITLTAACALIGGCTVGPAANGVSDQNKLLIFHNNSGPMCLEALEWLDLMISQHPELIVEEHLVFNSVDLDLLEQLESQFDQSQGVSTTFGFLPIVFFRGQAFSGFNDEVQEALVTLIGD